MVFDDGAPPRVAAVDEDSPAWAVGIRRGDVVWQISGRDLVDAPAGTLQEALATATESVVLLMPLSSVASHTSQLQ
jgi:C-terminal processing protease CtpA/Prc